MIVWFWSQRTFCFSLAFCYLLVFTCIAFFCMTPCLSSEWCYLMSCPEILRFIKCSHSLPPVLSLHFFSLIPRSVVPCFISLTVVLCVIHVVIPFCLIVHHTCYFSPCYQVFFNCTPDIKTMPNYQKKAAAG